MKWLLSIASVLALIVAGAQWNLLSKLRQENRGFRASVEKAMTEGQRPDAELLRQQDEELARLRDETKALARARNDVRLLRQQKPELDKLRAANQQLIAVQEAGTNAPGAGYVTGAALRDAGLLTPEAACQTVFFALRGGDARRLLDCFAPDAKERAAIADGGDEASRQMSEQFKKFPGFRIAEKNSASADEVELGIQCAPGGEVIKIPLRRYGSEWRILQIR